MVYFVQDFFDNVTAAPTTSITEHPAGVDGIVSSCICIDVNNLSIRKREYPVKCKIHQNFLQRCQEHILNLNGWSFKCHVADYDISVIIGQFLTKITIQDRATICFAYFVVRRINNIAFDIDKKQLCI